MGELPSNSSASRSRSLRWLGGLAFLVGLALLAWTLPLWRWIEDVEPWVRGRGALGVVVYGLVYVVATLLLVPGSALTLAGGALFGPVVGSAVVSTASTLTAGAAFLIARYLARERVRELAERYPRFRAIDAAIAAGGWRIVFLLRLSPAIPFSASNYLYGLSAVRFGPYLLASWVAMLPATVLYVYVGHAGALGFSAVAEDGSRGRGAGEWALLGVGLAATLAVTLYVTHLARKALRASAAGARESDA